VKFWGLPTAVHVLYIHRSQNKVLGIRGLVTLFLISSFVHSTKETKKEIKERKAKNKKERKL